MKVAICDDEMLCQKRVLDVATDYAEERKDTDIAIEMFSDPMALLRSAHENGGYDIYILDIVMPGMNGIKLGQALRNEGFDGKIIYLTSSEEYALDSFRVRAFDYMLKPVEKKMFYSVMDEAIASIYVKKDRVLVVKSKDNTARITFDSIQYAELKGRAVVYHLTDGKTVESTTLRTAFTEAVGELISDKRFVLCGASMAVNMHYVMMVETEAIVFANNERVLLGKKACRELRTAWNVYWITEGGGK